MKQNNPRKGTALLLEREGENLQRDGSRELKTEKLLHEHSLRVYLGDRLLLQAVCIPEHLPELVMGQLLSEGWISSKEDVLDIFFSSDQSRADVRLCRPLPQQPRPLIPVTPKPWKASWVFALADRFAQGMPLHDETWATHSCFLACGEELLFYCEDIGRHNALDKCLGYALLNRIRLEDCILYSSGRIPLDMASKAIRAGIPALITKASPTGDAVDLARHHKLTLICNARKDRMKIYSDFSEL